MGTTRRGLMASTLALAAWAGLAGTAMAAETIRIGAVIPTTGPLQVYGEAIIKALQLAVEEINDGGGVLGRELELVVADTATNPQVGVEAAKRLVSVDGAVALVGALSSGVTIPIATTVAAVEGVPQISPASTSPVITTLEDKGFLFRTTPSDALQGRILGKLVAEQGLKRVAVIYVNNDYGKGLAEAFRAAYGGEVTAMVAYEEKQASYRAELQQAARGEPEALVMIAYPGDGIPMLRQALEEGFFTRFVFTDGMKAREVVDAIGAPLEGAFGTAPTGDPEAEAAKRFRSAYEAKFGELPPQPFMDSAYDALYLLALAIEKAGSTEGARIRDALHQVANPPGEKILPGMWAKAREVLAGGGQVDYEGAAGPQDFDQAGDVPGLYEHWAIRDGKIVTVGVIRP